MEHLKGSSSDIGEQDHPKEREEKRDANEILEIMEQKEQTMSKNGTEYKILNTNI